MSPRRALFVALAAVGVALAACTDLSGLSGPSDAADAASEAAADVVPEAGADGPVLLDAADTDAPLVEDAGGAKVDASGCTACDCDQDGFNALTRAGCADAGGEDDCDDFDTRTRPNRGFNTALPEPPRNGDWNCKNGVEKAFPSNITCSELAGGPACDATSGFEDNPSCGATGKFVTCKSLNTLPLTRCAIQSMNLTTTQACR